MIESQLLPNGGGRNEHSQCRSCTPRGPDSDRTDPVVSQVLAQGGLPDQCDVTAAHNDGKGWSQPSSWPVNEFASTPGFSFTSPSSIPVSGSTSDPPNPSRRYQVNNQNVYDNQWPRNGGSGSGGGGPPSAMLGMDPFSTNPANLNTLWVRAVLTFPFLSSRCMDLYAIGLSSLESH